MQSEKPIVTAVLAAGASRRLGSPKQLLHLGAQSLLRHSLAAATEAALGPVWVLTGAQREALQSQWADMDVEEIYNPDWAEGMAASLRLAAARAQTLLGQGRAAGLLVLLCDQPHLSADLLRQMAHTFAAQACPLVACCYASGALGVPALFGPSMLGALQGLQGDTGARKMIAQHAAQVAEVSFPLGDVDIDTPEQWQHFLQNKKH